jgi:phospholipid transport system transporter-binding protein
MLKLPEILTQNCAMECLAGLTARVRDIHAERVVVDASDLRVFDSSALSVLLALRRACASEGKFFSVRGVPGRLGDLAKLYGVDGLFSRS